MAAGDWFFLKAHNFDAVGLHHPKWMLPLVQPHRHGCGCALDYMKIEQCAVVDGGDHVAVGDNERGSGLWIEKAQCQLFLCQDFSRTERYCLFRQGFGHRQALRFGFQTVSLPLFQLGSSDLLTNRR